MTKKQEEKIDFDVWFCQECEGTPQFERAEMMRHLKDVHQIDPTTAKGTRRMIMHLDGRDWFQSNYEWEINGMKFSNQVRCERSKNDMMRF
jgi:hypothetical protein